MKKSLILMLGLGVTLIVAGCTEDLPNEPASRTSHPNAPSLGAQATAILVQNPSFEDFSAKGLFTVHGVGLTGFGWTVTAGTNVGVFKAGGHFFVPIPDGINTAYSSNTTISQVLNEVLAPNTIYTLEVGIGNQNNVPFGGYRVQLLAGGTLLAEDNNTLSPANGTFQTSIVTFNALPNDPNWGQPLEIRLVPLGGSTINTNYDNVRLTKTTAVTVELAVEIDIKPGSDPNSINCNNENAVITVAILTTDDFDATTVDHTTVTFEGASETHVNKKTGDPRRHEEDVDGDGDTDLVFHFRLGDTDLGCDATEGILTGETFDGVPINGTDAVRMIDQGGGQP